MDFEAPEEVEKKAAVAALNVDELQQLGVTTKKAAELTTKLTKQNVKVLDALKELVTMGGGSCGKIGDVKGKLLFEFAQVLDGVSQDSLAALVALVCEGGIVEKQQVAFVLVCSCFTLLLFGKATEAVTLLKGNKNATKQELCDACGVGIVVTDEDIAAAVADAFVQHNAGIEANGHGEKGAIMKTCGAMAGLKWASKKKVSDEVAKQLVNRLGEEVKGKAKADRAAKLKAEKKERDAAERLRKEAEANEKAAAAAQASGEGDKKQNVTPWEVEAEGDEGVDYSKLIDEWGCEYITKKQIERIQKISGKPPHHFLRRGIFFSHRDLNFILDKAEAGEQFYLYTGRGPSSESMHLGHLIPFMFTKYLQDAFNVPLVIQMTDDEKFLFKEDLEIDVVRQHLRANAKDIIACGFNRETTFMFSDLDYITGGDGKGFYRNALEVQKRCSLNTAQKIFGFDESSNIGKISFGSIQASPSFASSFPFLDPKAACLIPCAIDQDPYFRMTREVAPRIKTLHPEGEHKPSLIHAKFFPAMTGSKSKMSSSGAGAVTTVFLTDDPASIDEKVTKHAFSGAPKTLKEHREKGANLEVDVAYQYLRFFCEDDAKVADIGKRYQAGEMVTSEVKKELVHCLQDLVRRHQEARAKVTEAEIDYFMSTAKFGVNIPYGTRTVPTASKATTARKGTGQAAVQSYLDQHDIQGMVQAALENLAKEMPPDPRAFLAEAFKW